MGEWGTGIFDNDDAADWAYGLEDGGLAHVESTLAATLTDDYLQSHTAAEALTAAETVARMLGQGAEQTVSTEAVDRWAEGSAPAPPDVVVQARLAIQRVLGDASELKELWEDAGGDDLAGWTTAVTDLDRRLAG